LPTANPLALGLAHAPSVLLAQRRRALDLVDGAGLRCRRRSLRLRRSNASCTGLGSSDEANSGEQRNNDTHRYTLHGATAPCRRGLRGISHLAGKAMSQVDSRYNGCVAFGASHARSCRAAALAALTRSSPRLKRASAAQSQFGIPCRPLSKRPSKPRRRGSPETPRRG
jgi:hypothetical protein